MVVGTKRRRGIERYLKKKKDGQAHSVRAAVGHTGLADRLAATTNCDFEKLNSLSYSFFFDKI